MIPKELDIFGVYVPPILIVAIGALFAAWAASLLLNRLRLWRYFANPQIAFLSIIVLFFAAFDALFMPV